MNWPPMEKVPAPEDRLRSAQTHYRAGEIEQFPLFIGELPVKPGHRRILTIAIVISVLRLAEFVTSQQHRHTLRKEEGSEEVSLLLSAQHVNLAMFGWTFAAAVPALVVIRAVAVFFPVSLVVLLVVADEIAEGKTIVCRDEVHARGRTSSVIAVEIAAAGKARRQLAHCAAISFPKPADAVPVFSIPLTPKNREIP